MSTKEIHEELIHAGDKASRELLVAFIKSLSRDAKTLSPDKLLYRGDIPNEDFPLKTGVGAAAYVSGVLLPRDWVEDDEQLQEVCELACELDIDSDSQELWNDFFAAVDKL